MSGDATKKGKIIGYVVAIIWVDAGKIDLGWETYATRRDANTCARHILHSNLTKRIIPVRLP